MKDKLLDDIKVIIFTQLRNYCNIRQAIHNIGSTVTLCCVTPLSSYILDSKNYISDMLYIVYVSLIVILCIVAMISVYLRVAWHYKSLMVSNEASIAVHVDNWVDFRCCLLRVASFEDFGDTLTACIVTSTTIVNMSNFLAGLSPNKDNNV